MKRSIKKYLGLVLTLSFTTGLIHSCGEEEMALKEEPMVFENPVASNEQRLDLGEDDSQDFSFHRIYHYYGADPYGVPYVSSWSSYFDPGLVDAYIPYIWEHPFYTYAFLFGGYDDDDDGGHNRHRGRHR